MAARQKPQGITIPLTSCILVIRLQQLSPAFHKYSTHVSASFSHFRYCHLMDSQAATEYLLDIEHAYTSSTEDSACSVEPGSAEDVGEIVS